MAVCAGGIFRKVVWVKGDDAWQIGPLSQSNKEYQRHEKETFVSALLLFVPIVRC